MLPLNPYGIYLKDNQAICIQCFNNYVAAEDYLNHLQSFETRVLRTNERAGAFSVSLKTDPQNMDLNLANTLFKGLSLSEIEQMIGFPKSFGSFDYGIEAGKYPVCLSIEFYNSQGFAPPGALIRGWFQI